MCIIYKHGRSEIFLPAESLHTVEKVYQLVTDLENISSNDFYLTFNGKCLQSDSIITSPCILRFHLRLLGGKGGFGSMLRAIGARIEKTTNHEACRDLSGRRMRDVNYEKEMSEWMKQKKENEEEGEEREKKRMEKLEKIINPKHNYQDKSYTSNLQNNAEKIDKALQFALQKRDEKSSSKRKMRDKESGSGKQKKSRMWIGVDDDGDNSDDNSEDIVSVSEDKPSCSKVGDNSSTERSMEFQIDSTDNSSAGNIQQPTLADVVPNCENAVSTAELTSVCGTSGVLNTDIETKDSGGNIQEPTSPDAVPNCEDVVSPSEITKDTVSTAELTSVCETSGVLNTDIETKDSAENIQEPTLPDPVPNCENVVSPSEINKDDVSTVELTSVCGTSGALNIDIETKDNNVSNVATTVDDTKSNHGVVDVNDYDSAEHLESVGLDTLKTALMALGLKCGGTLQERAQRLFLTKNTPLDKLNPSLFAKPSKGKKKKQKK